MNSKGYGLQKAEKAVDEIQQPFFFSVPGAGVEPACQ